MIIPVILPRDEDDEMGDLYVIASDRVLSLTKKFEGSARVPWEEWKDSLTFVGDSLPRFPKYYSTHGLVLFVGTAPSVMTGATPGIGFRVYNCGPRARHTHLGVARDAGLPYGSSKQSFDRWELQASETVTQVRYCEDNIVVHTVSAPFSRPSDFSLLCDRRRKKLRKPKSTSCPSDQMHSAQVNSCILYHSAYRHKASCEMINKSEERSETIRGEHEEEVKERK